MGARSTSYKSNDGESGLVPYDANRKLLASPLLPYEKELIRILGCTEEEYRRYTQEVALKSKQRPAGYEAIPDIRCDPVSIVVSLVIGLALTAVSSLLAPKPKTPTAQEERRNNGKNVRLASRQGGERFGATTGFDAITPLANYAEPIAVIFARREDGIGGVLASGQLVWSRAFSYGNEQGVKLFYVIGEAGMQDGIKGPDIEGIFLGNTPLDGLYANKFAFYWNRNTRVNGRIQARNFRYGTRATEDAGDPQTNDDILLAPSRTATNSPVFCQSFTPSSNASFGAYGAIPNGTNYRLNYQLIPLPEKDPGSSEEVESLSASVRKRVKITGDYQPSTVEFDVNFSRSNGQKGVGREYSRYMGMRYLNGGTPAPGGADGHKVFATVQVGDIAGFEINGKVIAEDKYWDGEERNDVNVDDINNATIRMREEADDVLQIGQIIMIGRTTWVVVARSIPLWGAGQVGPFETRETQIITLRCIEVFAAGAPANTVGFISADAITRSVRTDDQGKGTYEYLPPTRKGLSIGPGWFPLMQASFGLIRNTRPCDTTEMGIRSQVWNRANGLCNFGSLPTPAGMRRSDFNGDSTLSGTMNLYFNRTSVFTVLIRPAGLDLEGNKYDWSPIGEQFAIRGSRPVDQYNFLRFIHPERREYEYRFLPKNGCDLAAFTPDDAEFWLLDARLSSFAFQGAILKRQYQTAYGVFSVQAAGRLISKGEIEFAPELATGVKDNTQVRPIIDAPQDVAIAEYLPDTDGDDARATSVAWTGSYSSVPAGTQFRQAAWSWEAFGTASALGRTASFVYRHNGLRGDRWLELEYRGIVNLQYPQNSQFPGQYNWSLTSITVVNSSGGMNTGETFNCRVPTSPGNPRNPTGYTQVGVEVKVTETGDTVVAGGRESGYSFEVLGDADAKPVGTRESKNIILNSGGKQTIINYSAQVITAPSAQQQKFGVQNTWYNYQITAVPNSTIGNWVRGTQAQDIYTVSSDNPFRTPGTSVGAVYFVGGIRQEQEIVGLNSERVFEENGQITDISNYTERETSNRNAPEHTITYVTETIQPEVVANYTNLTSCALALRSGREFKTVDQLRTWLYDGLEVKRFHPSELGTIGASNMLPDLVYHLLTDSITGLGNYVSEELLDIESFSTACQFLKANKLYFNGAITEPQNLRDYVTKIAPFFLLDFSILNGKFSFQPAIPVTSSGEISTAAVPVAALFSEGNIVEGSFEVQYLEADQRRDFVAMMRWRNEKRNKFPEEKTIMVRFDEPNSQSYPIESFDLTDYCCSEAHAIVAAKYILSLRRRVTHTVSFKTAPLGLNLAPGNYIKVATQASPYQAANNGVIEDDGTLILSSPVEDDIYPIWYFDYASEEVVQGTMSVVGGKVVEETLWGTIVTLRYPGISTDVYQVQELSLEEDGLVQIVALEHPTDINGTSLIGLDLIPFSGNFVKGL